MREVTVGYPVKNKDSNNKDQNNKDQNKKDQNKESAEVKFEDFQQELLQFLARRFGSIPLAERIYSEMEKRIAESDMLALVGNPRVYLSSYGLSLGLQFLQEELGAKPQHREVM